MMQSPTQALIVCWVIAAAVILALTLCLSGCHGYDGHDHQLVHVESGIVLNDDTRPANPDGSRLIFGWICAAPRPPSDCPCGVLICPQDKNGDRIESLGQWRWERKGQ